MVLVRGKNYKIIRQGKIFRKCTKTGKIQFFIALGFQSFKFSVVKKTKQDNRTKEDDQKFENSKNKSNKQFENPNTNHTHTQNTNK